MKDLVGTGRELAEREGFEPSIEFPLYTLSKRAPSATRPSLLQGGSTILVKTLGRSLDNSMARMMTVIRIERVLASIRQHLGIRTPRAVGKTITGKVRPNCPPEVFGLGTPPSHIRAAQRMQAGL
jgi:hypothetical protein